MRNILLFTTLITFTLFALNGCSDDSPTAADGEPPAIPEVIPVVVDDAIFVNNNPSGEEFAAFNEAGSNAQMANLNLLSSMALAQGMFAFTAGRQPIFEDGMWVWEFTYPTGNESVSVKNTAEEKTGGTEWNIFLSGSFEDEESLNNFPLLSGIVSNNGDTGNWQFRYPGESENSVTTYEWSKESESDYNFSTEIRFDEREGEFIIDYDKDENDNFLNMAVFDESLNTTIYWNSSSGAGYIDKPGEERKCWDETFAQTECS